MPYILRDQIVESETFPGMHAKALVGKDNGKIIYSVGQEMRTRGECRIIFLAIAVEA